MTIAPTLQKDDRSRVAALEKYAILDTDPEQAFDDLALLASFICRTPIAMISLVDEKRQWFKSRVGITEPETSRNIAFCSTAIQQPDVFIVPEPNTVFTPAESTAIFGFVRDGGGLVAVADHIGSDRNGDGIDSPQIWNRLDTRHLLGASFDVSGPSSNFTEVWSTNVSPDSSDSTVYGREGAVNGLEFHNGTAMVLYPGINATVRGSVWRTDSLQDVSAVMAAHSVYGDGRVFFVGDSSPIDDGSAAPGNSSIFDGWAEAAGGDSLLLMNATEWATRRDVQPLAVAPAPATMRAPFPNPSRAGVRIDLDLRRAAAVTVDVYDVSGRRLRTLMHARLDPGVHEVTWDGLGPDGARAPAGIYLVQARVGGDTRRWTLVRLR